MAEDFVQIKIDIGELKSNVGFIKSDITDMKHTVAGAIEKISNSMATMASVSEKLMYNDEAHKGMNLKIEGIMEAQLEQHEKLSALMLSHDACLSTRKLKEEVKKNSPWNRAKDKIVEYLFIVLITITAFVLLTHVDDYIKFINRNEGKTPTVTAPIPIPSD